MHGSFSEEALEQFAQLANQTQAADFAEGDLYDFTRCVRPDGSAYGTRGKCRKGSEAGPAEKREGTGARGGREAVEKARTEGQKGGALRTARAAGKKAALEAARAEGGTKISANNARARLLREELEKVKEKMRGAPPEEQNRLLQEASKKASERAAAGEGKAAAKPKRKLSTSSEAKETWSKTEAALKSAKANFKKVKLETKGDKSPEARKRLLAAGTLLDRAERAAEKASEKLFAAGKRERKAAMTPEQRKEEREWEKQKKLLG